VWMRCSRVFERMLCLHAPLSGSRFLKGRQLTCASVAVLSCNAFSTGFTLNRASTLELAGGVVLVDKTVMLPPHPSPSSSSSPSHLMLTLTLTLPLPLKLRALV
jgi:hypothetical protein